jgi:hypothetical protein
MGRLHNALISDGSLISSVRRGNPGDRNRRLSSEFFVYSVPGQVTHSVTAICERDMTSIAAEIRD